MGECVLPNTLVGAHTTLVLSLATSLSCAMYRGMAGITDTGPPIGDYGSNQGLGST